MQEIDPRALRDALGLYPTGVTVVTAYDAQDNPAGITVNSFASVSLSPPLVLWSVDKGGSTHDIYTQAEHFCIHFLRQDQANLSQRFSAVMENRFDGISWSRGEHGSPLLEGCVAKIDCVRETVFPGGDHSIIVGRVVNLDTDSTNSPLVFHQGSYKKL